MHCTTILNSSICSHTLPSHTTHTPTRTNKTISEELVQSCYGSPCDRPCGVITLNDGTEWSDEGTHVQSRETVSVMKSGLQLIQGLDERVLVVLL